MDPILLILIVGAVLWGVGLAIMIVWDGRLRFLYRISGRLPCRLINVDDAPYLERYHVARWGGVHVYLHRFVRNDAERHVHDHPWRAAFSFVLAGRYTEELATYDDPAVGYRTRTRTVRWFNWITPRTRHRICAVKPETWTLFITVKRFKDWGFYERVAQVLDHGISIDVVYSQPYDTAGSAGWYKSALTGLEVGREPMREG